jgi:protein-tyrosine phosphatase
VLFVCTGNICRSPTVEGVLRTKLAERAPGKKVRIESAGMQDYHVGEAPDPRSQRHAALRGYDLSKQRARLVCERDFHEFTWILAMDRSHLRQLQAIAPRDSTARLNLFLDFSRAYAGREMPDPYYGGAAGFEMVLDMAEEGAAGLLEEIMRS